MSEQHNLFYWQTLIGKSKNQEKKMLQLDGNSQCCLQWETGMVLVTVETRLVRFTQGLGLELLQKPLKQVLPIMA